MTDSVTFRRYRSSDLERCLEIFDANCPEYFAPSERAEFQAFLAESPPAYEVALGGGRIVGAFGLTGSGSARRRLNWILLDPRSQGLGIGSVIMNRVVSMAAAAGVTVIDIAASHRSAPFFARFGARPVRVTENGWGPGMHRHDMELEIPATLRELGIRAESPAG